MDMLICMFMVLSLTVISPLPVSKVIVPTIAESPNSTGKGNWGVAPGSSEMVPVLPMTTRSPSIDSTS